MAKKVSIRKKRKIARYLLTLVTILLVFVLSYYIKDKLPLDNNSSSEVFSDSSNSEESYSSENIENIIYDDFQMHFIELGVYNTGDCTYIKAGETDILIDAGATIESSQTIINYVNQYCLDGVLEYVITTHAHTDHYASMFGSKKASINFKGESIERNGIMYYYDINTIIDFSLTNQKESASYYTNYKNAVEYAKTQGDIRYSADQCFNELDGGKRQFIID